MAQSLNGRCDGGLFVYMADSPRRSTFEQEAPIQRQICCGMHRHQLQDGQRGNLASASPIRWIRWPGSQSLRRIQEKIASRKECLRQPDAGHCMKFEGIPSTRRNHRTFLEAREVKPKCNRIFRCLRENMAYTWRTTVDNNDAFS